MMHIPEIWARIIKCLGPDDKFSLKLASKFFSKLIGPTQIPIKLITTIDKLKWAMKYGYCFSSLTPFYKHGILEVVKHIVNGRRLSIGYNELIYAFESGNLELFQWIISHPQFKCLTEEISDVISNNPLNADRIHIIKWCEGKYDIYDSIIVYAVLYGNIEFLNWIKEHNYYNNMYPNLYCEIILSKNFININGLNWLVNSDYIGEHRDEELLECALYNGNLNVVKWLYEIDIVTHNYTWSSDSFRYAIISGNIALVEWLKTTDCPEYMDAEV